MSVRIKNLKSPRVAIIMGSQSDLKVMQGAVEALKELGVDYCIKIVSAHRTPEMMYEFAKSARSEGFVVIIAGAGGAAHLPGMVASLTTLPVIGVPVTIAPLKGLDSLLSIAQMPKGVPVATVAIDNAYNAGVLAARMIGIQDTPIGKKVAISLEKFQVKQIKKVAKMNKDLRGAIKKLL